MTRLKQASCIIFMYFLNFNPLANLFFAMILLAIVMEPKKPKVRSICDDYLHHWRLASSRVTFAGAAQQNRLQNQSHFQNYTCLCIFMHRSKLKLTLIFHYICFILPQMNVVLHFCWLFYYAAPAKVTQDETRRAANNVNNWYITVQIYILCPRA